MAQAIAVMQEVLKSGNDNADKLVTVLDFDKVFGLDLSAIEKIKELPAEIEKLKEKRIKVRADKNFEESDRLRAKIEKAGFIVEDNKERMRIYKK